MNNKKSPQHSDAKLRLGTFATVWARVVEYVIVVVTGYLKNSIKIVESSSQLSMSDI